MMEGEEYIVLLVLLFPHMGNGLFPLTTQRSAIAICHYTKVLSNSIHLFCEYRQKLPLSSNHPLLVMAIRRASIHTQVQHMKETAKG
jgi:hypothetical protein